MKKPSKKWKEFGQIIEIVDIRIEKQARKLDKLQKKRAEIKQALLSKWDEIEALQHHLQSMGMQNEQDGLKRLFMRRESIRSKIESTFYDASVIKQDLDEVMIEMQQVQQEKRNLEKRKDRLVEMREQLMYE
ncbi:hypothetical protein AL542_15730 [Grimontia hollisae]|uniref:Uncharacterized protein n=2 Tax=Grimontia hollisae TaxID=673 RepID=D0I693_GRIHO|nr:hypothetical protein [Grimontia hollisae]AMG31638.1 hypothetical protein AL542_15730 [Grimontia hollisae]EEY72162.1 hypothetical protein VHA_001260 [Grimontia hollisae CIP 101886]MDF2186013.1 hypothetical protein [Grimontia hollisae]STO45178.1 Uncharacterised protein [Grimontia hollisae]STO57768.1 Uncharacterised protein [Grimontia hollisae]